MPLEPSGTYNFQSIENEELIRECFENIGISGEIITPVQMDAARRSLNLLLLSWISKSTNLWTLNLGYLTLNTGQGSYALPSTITDVLQVNYRSFIRPLTGPPGLIPPVLTGTPQTNTIATYDNAGGGVVANAFYGNTSAGCRQGAANGNISFDFATQNGNLIPNFTVNIPFIGIQSNTNTLYTLVVEASQNTINWTNILTIPPQIFNIGQALWFDVPAPNSYRAYRVREINGATLDLQEIYFVNNIFDTKMSRVSRDTYLSFAQKSVQGRPSAFYFNKQINPTLNLWYAPTDQYATVLQYSYINIMNDAGYYYNVANIPSRMLPALVAGLTWKIAVKYKMEMAESIKAEYEESFSIATANDEENVDWLIEIDTSDYYR